MELEVGDRTVRLSNPDRVYFPATGATKLDLARYYLAVGDGIVRALRERPCMMHRFPEGLSGEKVHQKRLPARRAAVGGDRAGVTSRSGRHADELCVTELASVIWAVQMSTVEFHPWNSRRADTERPDEWRIDLDPMPECAFDTVRRVAHVAHEVLDELGAVGWPKTSGGKGLHVYVRIEPRWGFADVRRAALAFAREVERRAPRRRHHHVVAQGPRPRRRCSSTTTRTPATTRSPAPTRCAACPRRRCRRRSRWAEVDDVAPGDCTIATVPGRFATLGDLHAGIDDAAFASTPCWSGPTATSARERPTPAGRPTFRRASRGDAVAPPGRA